MVRVVLDTVVLVRGLINPYGIWGQLLFACAGSYRLVISPLLLTEYLEVTARPELTRKFKNLPAHLRDLLDLLAQAEVVMLGELPKFAREPQDAHVLATTLSGAVDYIVSEDRDLLDLGEYRGTPIVTAATFLDLLERAGQE